MSAARIAGHQRKWSPSLIVTIGGWHLLIGMPGVLYRMAAKVMMRGSGIGPIAINGS